MECNRLSWPIIWKLEINDCHEQKGSTGAEIVSESPTKSRSLKEASKYKANGKAERLPES